MFPVQGLFLTVVGYPVIFSSEKPDCPQGNSEGSHTWDLRSALAAYMTMASGSIRMVQYGRVA